MNNINQNNMAQYPLRFQQNRNVPDFRNVRLPQQGNIVAPLDQQRPQNIVAPWGQQRPQNIVPPWGQQRPQNIVAPWGQQRVRQPMFARQDENMNIEPMDIENEDVIMNESPLRAVCKGLNNKDCMSRSKDCILVKERMNKNKKMVSSYCRLKKVSGKKDKVKDKVKKESKGCVVVNEKKYLSRPSPPRRANHPSCRDQMFYGNDGLLYLSNQTKMEFIDGLK